MKENSKENETVQFFSKWKFFSKYFILMFLTIILAFLFVFSVIEYNNIDTLRSELYKNEKRVVQLEKTIIGDALEGINEDLLFLKATYEKNSDKGSTDLLKTIWLEFSKNMKTYDQLRYIDENGKEALRINYNNGDAYVVEDDKLQDKSNRYYFTDVMELDRDEIYYSKFDLNIENGEIEQPIKPMIRVGIKVYDDNGNEKGVVLVNYFGINLINKFNDAEETSIGHIAIVNSNGYYIEGPYDEYNFAFMYDEKLDLTITNQFDGVFDKVLSSSVGDVLTEDGLFTFSEIVIREDPIDNNKIIFGDGSLKIISFVERNSSNNTILTDNILKSVFDKFIKEFISFIIIALISLIFAFLMLLNKTASSKVKYFSEMDPMTNVLNRRTGVKLIEKTHKEKNNKGNSTICFIDVDGLKHVNDTYGHTEGDYLIVSIVDAIKENIRAKDFVIRMGGDEFLIMLTEATSETAEKVWSRISNSLDKRNKESNLKYKLSASHGTVTFDSSTKESIDSLIKIADERMYIEKRKKYAERV